MSDKQTESDVPRSEQILRDRLMELRRHRDSAVEDMGRGRFREDAALTLAADLSWAIGYIDGRLLNSGR